MCLQLHVWEYSLSETSKMFQNLPEWPLFFKVPCIVSLKWAEEKVIAPWSTAPEGSTRSTGDWLLPVPQTGANLPHCFGPVLEIS